MGVTFRRWADGGLPQVPSVLPEEWSQIKPLLEVALALSESERGVYLEGIRARRPELHDELLSLVRAAALDESFLETPCLVTSSVPEDAQIGTGARLGPYRLIQKIGAGGMGAVWRAERDDGQYRKQVAVKLLQGGFGTEYFLNRFRQERQILANLDHPNIAHLLDGGSTADGLPYVVMEYVDGVPIDKFCDAGDLSVEARLTLFRAVCAAVQYAHSRHVIHRDLKPANILVTADAVPKLLDFGIAKVLEPPSAAAGADRSVALLHVMTPDFASPEQARGEAVSPASDVYSLGVILYVLLTGQRPYTIVGASPEQVVRAICETQPRRPSQATVPSAAGDVPAAVRPAGTLPRDLDDIVLKALRKDPAQRYRSAAEFAEDIGRYLSGVPVQARGGAVTYAVSKFLRRHATRLWAGAATVAALAAMAFYAGAIRVHDVRAVSLSAPAHSVAVLPFVDMSENHDQEYFSDGLAEELGNLLSSVPDLHVAARTSAFAFKGKGEQVASIGQKLHVANLLEGSVRRSGARLRITAELIRADDGYRLWSQTYERSVGDIFDIQDEVAKTVVTVLKIKLHEGELEDHSRAQSAEAYNLLLQGRFFGRRQTSADRETSIGFYRRAVELDPGYALAWSWLSTGYGVQAANRWVAPEIGYASARDAASHALQLDPQLADAHVAMGYVYEMHDWNWTGAAAEYRRAVELNPGSVRAWNVLAHLSMVFGRLTEGAEMYRKALACDPLSAGANVGLGSALVRSGRLAEAEAAYRQAVALAPQFSGLHAWLGAILARRGQVDAGLAEILSERDEPSRLFELAVTYFAIGRRADSDRALAALEATHPEVPYAIGQAHAARGELDQAFEWLGRAYERRDTSMNFLKIDGDVALHHDPRYQELLRKMNLS